MKKAVTTYILVMVAVSVVTGCANTSQRYYWGSYESLLYAMYVKPDKAIPSVQIERLTADINNAQKSGKAVPPGMYAHLGLMYAMQENSIQAQVAFKKEKALYPESAVLIDGMLGRVGVNVPLQTQAVEETL